MTGERDERPWGSYAVLDDQPGHKVKRIVVKPGQRLSYQRHAQRSEHWFVVAGHGRVTLDGVAHERAKGDSIDVPAGVAHRIENPGSVDLVFIEVQRDVLQRRRHRPPRRRLRQASHLASGDSCAVPGAWCDQSPLLRTFHDESG